MFLRNKIVTLSFTLMSLMTIPTLAENDNQPVNSRIESKNFDVQINTPESWSETKDFSNSIPETFTMNGATYRGLQFRNGLEGHGCAIFFAEDSLNDDDEDDEGLLKALVEAKEVSFPGSDLSTFTVSKFAIDGSFAADFNAETAKVSLKGTIEGNVTREAGEGTIEGNDTRETEDPTKLTITGKIQADSTRGNDFIVGTGSVSQEGATPIRGTTGVLWADDYNLIIAIWGTDEESQVRDTFRFIQATKVIKKAPVEIAVETIAVLTNDAVVVSEAVAEPTGDAVVVTESIAEVTDDAVVVSEAVAEPTGDAVVVSEAVAVPTNDAVVASEAPDEATSDAVIVTESVAVVKAAPVKTEARA